MLQQLSQVVFNSANLAAEIDCDQNEHNSEQGNYRSAALFTYTTLLDHQTTLAITLGKCGLNYLPVFN